LNPRRFLTALLLFLPLLPLSSAHNTIEIVCRKSYYTPDKIVISKGELARIVLTSQDVTHGFAIDEFDVAREVPAGPPTVIEFTPDRAGEFRFYCVVRCGRDHLKMQGTLVVE